MIKGNENESIYINMHDLVEFTMALPEKDRYKYDMLHKIWEARYSDDVRVYNSETGRAK